MKKIVVMVMFIALSISLKSQNSSENIIAGNHGLYIGPKLWHTMFEFSKDCIILVFASDYYNESDYIRDYDEFKKNI